MSTSRHPYPPSPAVQARNDAHRAVLAAVDEAATSPLHAYRARVRLASTVPPPAVPTDDQVHAALAATAPEETPAAMAAAPAPRRLEVVR